MPKTPEYFRGKSIIITGAASGIGLAAARTFVRAEEIGKMVLLACSDACEFMTGIRS
ncbi:hypothetical protein ACFLQ0_02630 [Nitrospinota bacterium]